MEVIIMSKNKIKCIEIIESKATRYVYDEPVDPAECLIGINGNLEPVSSEPLTIECGNDTDDNKQPDNEQSDTSKMRSLKIYGYLFDAHAISNLFNRDVSDVNDALKDTKSAGYDKIRTDLKNMCREITKKSSKKIY